MPRKIDEHIVEEARRLAFSGKMTNKGIGALLGISEASVSLFKHGRRQKSNPSSYRPPKYVDDLSGELWTPVRGFEDYHISNLGRLKRVSGGWSGSVERLMHPANSKGYAIVILHSSGCRKTANIHRLVAEAFIPFVDGKDQVNHKDGNKRNNQATNLEWVTCQENIRHAIVNGLRKVKGNHD